MRYNEHIFIYVVQFETYSLLPENMSAQKAQQRSLGGDGRVAMVEWRWSRVERPTRLWRGPRRGKRGHFGILPWRHMFLPNQVSSEAGPPLICVFRQAATMPSFPIYPSPLVALTQPRHGLSIACPSQLYCVCLSSVSCSWRNAAADILSSCLFGLGRRLARRVPWACSTHGPIDAGGEWVGI